MKLDLPRYHTVHDFKQTFKTCPVCGVECLQRSRRQINGITIATCDCGFSASIKNSGGNITFQIDIKSNDSIFIAICFSKEGAQFISQPLFTDEEDFVKVLDPNPIIDLSSIVGLVDKYKLLA